MTILFKNSANSSLSGNIDNVTTSLTVAAGTGALFPSPGAGQFFDVVLEDRRTTPIKREICRCTSRSVDTLTVTRGTGGTTAQSFLSGTTVSNRVTAEGLEDLKADAIAGQKYLGLYATAPATRDDGSPLVAGDQYWDSVKTNQFVWTGAAWALTIRPQEDFAVGGSLDVVGDVTIGGASRMEGNLHVIGTLLVDGASTLTGDAELSGAVTVGGAFTGAATVPAIFGGAMSVGGAVTAGGSGHFTGDVIATGNIGAATLMAGTAIKINNADVAIYNDVSGGTNSQNFPSGHIFKWGNDQTSSGKFYPKGQIRIDFDVAFPNACVAVYCQPLYGGVYGAGDRFGASLWVPSGMIDQYGFTVVSFNPVQEPEGPISFFWWAIGG